jgi:hypothetical protein
VVTGPYLAAVAAYGSPSGPAALRSASRPDRALVDLMLLRGLPMKLTSVSAVPQSATACALRPAHGYVVVPLPAGGLWLRAPSTGPALVSVRSYSPDFAAVPGGKLAPGQTVHLTWPGARTPIHWLVALVGSPTCQR